jgi:hypothetical protein
MGGVSMSMLFAYDGHFVQYQKSALAIRRLLGLNERWC